jgi:homoserine dehydrogenase
MGVPSLGARFHLMPTGKNGLYDPMVAGGFPVIQFVKEVLAAFS